MPKCNVCGAPLGVDEEGLCKKMLGPYTDCFYCLECFAAKMKVPPSALQNVILKYRKSGCTLFTPLDEDDTAETDKGETRK